MKTIEELEQDAEAALEGLAAAAEAYADTVSKCEQDELAHMRHKAAAVRRLLGGQPGEPGPFLNSPETNPATGKPHTETSAKDYVCLDGKYAEVLREESMHRVDKARTEGQLRHAEQAAVYAIALRARMGAIV